MWTRRIEKNCVACVLRCLTCFGGPVGMPCLRITCTHTNAQNFSSTTQPKLYKLTTLTTIFFLIGVSVGYVRVIRASQTDDVNFLIIQISNFLLCVRTAAILILGLKNISIAQNIVVSFESCIKFWHEQTSQILLDQKLITILRIKVILMAFLIIALLIIYGTVSMLFINFGSFWGLVEIWASCLCTYVDFVIILDVAIYSELYREIMKNYQKNIKSLLGRRLNNLEKRCSRSEAAEKFVESLLWQGRRMHGSIVHLMKVLSAFMGFAIVIWFAVGIVILIVNNFLIVKIWILSNFRAHDLQYIAVEFQIVIIYMVIYVTQRKVGRLQEEVRR